VSCVVCCERKFEINEHRVDVRATLDVFEMEFDKFDNSISTIITVEPTIN
jgi:hypothetical protein